MQEKKYCVWEIPNARGKNKAFLSFFEMDEMKFYQNPNHCFKIHLDKSGEQKKQVATDKHFLEMVSITVTFMIQSSTIYESVVWVLFIFHQQNYYLLFRFFQMVSFLFLVSRAAVHRIAELCLISTDKHGFVIIHLCTTIFDGTPKHPADKKFSSSECCCYFTVIHCVYS